MSSELEQLKGLWSAGVLNASEFARMAAELNGAGPSGASTSSASDAPQPEPADEEEMLVDEYGDQYHSQEASTAPMAQQAASATLGADAFSEVGSFGADGSPPDSPLGSPVSSAPAASPAQFADGPAVWESGMTV